MHICIHIYTYTYVHIHIYIHIYTYAYVHTHIYIHIYTYAYIHMHIHIHIYLNHKWGKSMVTLKLILVSLDVAVCCSVLQCVEVCCRNMFAVKLLVSVDSRIGLSPCWCCNVLQCVLQCIAVRCSVWQHIGPIL